MTIIEEMNGFDIFVIFIVMGSSLISLNKGFLASVLGLASWIGGIFFSQKLYAFLEPVLMEKLGSKFLSMTIGYGACLFILMISLAILRFIILSNTKAIRRTFMDRILGLMFGLFRGVAVCVIIFIGCNIFTSGVNGTDFDDHSVMPASITNAMSYEYLYDGSKYLMNLFSDDTIEKIKMKKKLPNLSESYLEDLIMQLSTGIDKEILHSLQDMSAQRKSEGVNDRDIAIDVIQNLIKYHSSKDNTDILNHDSVIKFRQQIEKEEEYKNGMRKIIKEKTSKHSAKKS